VQFSLDNFRISEPGDQAMITKADNKLIGLRGAHYWKTKQ
jgi:hypothetical protein